MPTSLDQLVRLTSGAATAATRANAGDWSGGASALGRGLVGRVEIRSQVAPPISFDPFAPTPPEAPPSPILSITKPQFIIFDPEGQVVMTAAPYGEPTANYLPWLVGGVVVFVVGAFTIAAAIGAAISRARARRTK